MIIKTHAFPRAALIGNPSDGYFGKTIAFTFSNFQTDVTLYPSPEIEILPTRRDRTIFESIGEFSEDIGRYGYYGGLRVIKAAIARFLKHCEKSDIRLQGGNFTIRCHTSIPPHLGLAGSSSIITAVVLALMKHYSVSIPRPELANLVLATETEELGISAGLQDRVAQVYRGITYMDFNERLMNERGYGDYIPLIPESLPRIYLAYNRSAAEGSDVVHNNLRYRFDRGEQGVVAAMEEFARLSDRAKRMFDSGDYSELPEVINRNFDLRASICDISPRNRQLVNTARSTGASAKFTGSGGAVIGTYNDDEALERLRSAMKDIRAEVIQPIIAWPHDNPPDRNTGNKE